MKASIIICSYDGNRNGNVIKLKNDLKKQTFKDWEFIFIIGVSPVGKARNKGIEKANGNIIIFLDDDIRLPQNNILEKLIIGLKKYPKAIVGSSKLIPKNSNFFQKWLAKEMPREEIKISEKDIKTDEIGTCCWASKKNIYQKIGNFKEEITFADDTEFRQRARKNGYRTILIRNTYVIHPPKRNLKEFIKQMIVYGKGIGLLYFFQNKRSKLYRTLYLLSYSLFKVITLPIQIFIPNINIVVKEKRKITISVRPLYVFGLLFYTMGFIKGAIKRS